MLAAEGFETADEVVFAEPGDMTLLEQEQFDSSPRT